MFHFLPVMWYRFVTSLFIILIALSFIGGWKILDFLMDMNGYTKYILFIADKEGYGLYTMQNFYLARHVGLGDYRLKKTF